MGLNDTVSAERVHIGFFGLCNAGKSSLVNAVTAQNLSVVSDTKGTTTDPVKKAMELLPLGPVVMIDTPGLDDQGALGNLRVKKAQEMLALTDIAVLVIDSITGIEEVHQALLAKLKERGIPYLIAYNKVDLLSQRLEIGDDALYVSTLTGEGINDLKERLGRFAKLLKNPKPLVADLISAGDLVILVTPIDESAPKGRLILPQQMVLRDCLDAHAIAIVCQPEELPHTLSKLPSPPRMVITDSQVFEQVAKDTPTEIPLTSFSILMARYKGNLTELVRGFQTLSTLSDADEILICEGCTHHRQCNDIGTVKLPHWICQFTHANPRMHFTSGMGFPEDLAPYRLIVHCGGCMLTEKEMQHRIACAESAGIPMVNYGVAIAGMRGILSRSLELFPEVKSLLK